MPTTATTSSSPDYEYTAHVTTPLNACSLECLPDNPVATNDGTKVLWPLMLGCYQLDESTGERRGYLDLYAVPVPKNSNSHSQDLQDNVEEVDPSVHVEGLGAPLHVMGGANDNVSGVLDGKWCPRSTEAQSAANELLIYATAHATGEIQIHHIRDTTTTEALQERDGSSPFPFDVTQVGKSQPDSDGLCLALSWDLVKDGNYIQPFSSRNIISSYSDGKVSIHNVHFTMSEDSSLDQSGVIPNCSLSAKLELVHSWTAHKMFHSPVEVWAASFTTKKDVVLTGGDEGQLKIWDLRAGTLRPIQTVKDAFEAGVTVLSPHPRREHWVACGSYDETMAVLDLRSVSTSQAPKFLCHSDPLGGGMWRIKWHPKRDNRLLLGAMHGGCRVIDLVSTSDDESSSSPDENFGVRVHQKFTQHKSMAYGADWLVYQPPGQRQLAEAAVSCSFYDKAMYLWNVKE